MRASSPCDLPMIYVKKMQLHAATNRMDLVEAALRQSTRCADSCAIIKYNIYAYDELLAIHKNRHDIAGIAATTPKLDSLNTIYAQANNIAALHDQKETMLLGAKDRVLQREQTSKNYLRAAIAGLLLVALALLGRLLIHSRKQRRLEAEFNRMKAELGAYLTQSQTARAGPAEREHLSQLSERQREVLTQMMRGLSNKEIADKLFVSENTVKYHIKNIYQLLEIKDRKELLANTKK